MVGVSRSPNSVWWSGKRIQCGQFALPPDLSFSLLASALSGGLLVVSAAPQFLGDPFLIDQSLESADGPFDVVVHYSNIQPFFTVVEIIFHACVPYLIVWLEQVTHLV